MGLIPIPTYILTVLLFLVLIVGAVAIIIFAAIALSRSKSGRERNLENKVGELSDQVATAHQQLDHVRSQPQQQSDHTLSP